MSNIRINGHSGDREWYIGGVFAQRYVSAVWVTDGSANTWRQVDAIWTNGGVGSTSWSTFDPPAAGGSPDCFDLSYCNLGVAQYRWRSRFTPAADAYAVQVQWNVNNVDETPNAEQIYSGTGFMESYRNYFWADPSTRPTPQGKARYRQRYALAGFGGWSAWSAQVSLTEITC